MFGFGFNKEKSRANAERYLRQNKLQFAINEYEKILQAEPKDLAILNTVGDIYARLGQNDKAIERFKVVGESYATDGFLLKAIALYKKVTKLDPNGMPAIEKLAELYRKQGLVGDARSMLLMAAEAYTRKGQNKETLRLLKQLVLFDPENVQVITRTADLMTQGGQRDEAKEMLGQTANTLIERHALEPATKILDRLIALDRTNLRSQELRAQVSYELGDNQKAVELYEAIPDIDSRPDALRNLLEASLKLGNLDNALLLARKLMTVHHDADGVISVAARLYKENDTLRAINLYSEFATEVFGHDKEEVLAHLHGSVSRVRNNPEALQTLYNLFQRAGETSMIAEILELMAHAAVQSNQLERARDAYKQLIELEPDNASHIQGYRQVCALLGPGGAVPVPVPAPRAEAEPRTLEEFLHTSEPTLPTQSYPPEIEDQIATALTEAELSESFASKTRGITALEAALHSAPDDLRLNSTLAMLYMQEGQTPRAIQCYSVMQRVLEALGESEAAGYYAKLAGTGQTTTWEAKSGEFAPSDFSLGDPNSTENTEEIDLSGEWESAWQDAPESASTAPVAAAPPENIAELLEEVHFCLNQQIWSEAEVAIDRLAKVFPEHPELPALRAKLRLGHDEAAPAPVAPEMPPGFAPVEVIEVSDRHSAPRTPPPAPTLNSLAAELDAELGDSFAPAPQSRRTPPAHVSQPPAAPAAHVAPTRAAASYAPVPPQQPQHVEQIVAAEELEVVTPSVFGDLLQDFERDLAAPEQDDDDLETHFNLGIAFREMGLLDEAIGELQKVCRQGATRLSKARAQEAYIWLATCFVEKSVPEASFKWFQRALETAPNEESRTAVTYELASAYEAAGQKKEALQHFMEVYGNNIDYRDVATRIRELRASV